MIYWHDKITDYIDSIFLSEKIISYKRHVSITMRSYSDRIKFTNGYYFELRIDNVSYGYSSFGLYKEEETLFRYTSDHFLNSYFIKKYIKYFHDKVKQLDRNSFKIETTVERYFE